MNTKEQGFTGISFPFRIGVKGGVVTSTTSISNMQHILEAMKQILLTRPRERCMEYHFKCDVDLDIFEPNDVSCRTLIAYQVEEALRELEDRIRVDSVDVVSEDSAINAVINFTVLKYNTVHLAVIKVGDLNVQSSDQRNRLHQ